MESPVYYSSSSSPSKHITVIDVYDLAESINRDFEMLVAQFGNGPFDSVVRKVISALETLEALAKYNDKDSAQLVDLQNTIERFEQEKRQRLRDRDNLEKDFMELEDNYKQEIGELCKIVQKLKADNKSMRDQISATPSANCADGPDSMDAQTAADEQIQALIDLRRMAQTQKERIKELQSDLDSYCDEVDTLKDSIERLIRQNKELLRKNSSLQKQGRVLLLERAEILRRLQQAEEEIVQLRRVLNETSRACRDMEEAAHMQQRRDEAAAAQDSLNQPCFSLSELREVLQEKNALKALVLQLEERIADGRTAGTSPPPPADIVAGGVSSSSVVSSLSVAVVCPSPAALLSTVCPQATVSAEDIQKAAAAAVSEPVQHQGGSYQTAAATADAEECLVFGPINREPEEKLHPWKYERKDSGVRKFFRFFKVSLGASLSPRESSGKLGEL